MKKIYECLSEEIEEFILLKCISMKEYQKYFLKIVRLFKNDTSKTR